MNSTTRTLVTAPAPALAASLPPAPAVRLARRWRARQIGLRPWLLSSGLGPVSALPTAPGVARGSTTTVLGGWGLASRGDLVDAAALVVSELATNVVDRAVDAGGNRLQQADGPITVLWLRLLSDQATLRVELRDNLPPAAGYPVLRTPDPAEEHGRGLAVVQQLSRAWGWHPIPGKQAKCTWAVLDAAQRPVPGPSTR